MYGELITRAVLDYQSPANPESTHTRGMGWIDDAYSGWMLIWMMIPEAAGACSELIKCSCKSGRGCISCKCKTLNYNVLPSLLVIVKFNCYHKDNLKIELRK